MKNLTYLLLIPIILFYSCKDDSADNDSSSDELVNILTFNIDGTETEISFDCSNQPAVYASGVRTDETTGKFLFDQGYTAIPISSDQELIYQIIIFSEVDIRDLNGAALKTFINNNPDAVQIDITLNENNKTFKNQYYELSGFNVLYEERRTVAENEVFTITTGEVNAFDCTDNKETIALEIEYSGILKTADEIDQKSLSLDFQSHLTLWN